LNGISKIQGRLHSKLYRRFGDTRFGKWLGHTVFQLTVAGRKSGVPRSVVLMLVHDGDDLLVRSAAITRRRTGGTIWSPRRAVTGQRGTG
jgi:hypothetical protein